MDNLGRSEDAKREQAKNKRLQTKRSQQQPGDTAAIYGPPDKQQNFLSKEDEDFKKEEKTQDRRKSKG